MTVTSREKWRAESTLIGGFVDVLTDVIPGDNPVPQGVSDVLETINNPGQAIADGNPVMQGVAGSHGVPSGVIDFAQQIMPCTPNQEGSSMFNGGMMGMQQMQNVPQMVQDGWNNATNSDGWNNATNSVSSIGMGSAGTGVTGSAGHTPVIANPLTATQNVIWLIRSKRESVGNLTNSIRKT